MNIPKYRLNLKGLDIDGDHYNCTGRQLLKVINSICNFYSSVVWYASDISVSSGVPYWNKFEPFHPLLVGRTSDLNPKLMEVEQFFSGVFFGVLESRDNIKWNYEHETEGSTFSDIEESFIQIRAFDTSYLETYSSDRTLLERLQNEFGGVISHKN